MKRIALIFALAAFLGSGLSVLAEASNLSTGTPQERPVLSTPSIFSEPVPAGQADGFSGVELTTLRARGHSSFWFAAGSHGYFGGGLSTVQPFMIGDVPFFYGLSISREQGRDWFTGLDYRSQIFSPFVGWHGERTSAQVGFTAVETTFTGTPRPAVRPVLSPGPLAVGQGMNDRIDNRLSTRGVHVGIQHRLSDNVEISVSVQGAAHSLNRR